MQNLKRLVTKCDLPVEVAKAVLYLMHGDGTCTCGRYLASLDGKFILCNVGISRPMVLAAYCYDCFTKINNTMKRCQNAAYKQKRSEAELRG
jgi:hypothetical protein